jgi:hypothetical protein
MFPLCGEKMKHACDGRPLIKMWIRAIIVSSWKQKEVFWPSAEHGQVQKPPLEVSGNFLQWVAVLGSRWANFLGVDLGVALSPLPESSLRSSYPTTVKARVRGQPSMVSSQQKNPGFSIENCGRAPREGALRQCFSGEFSELQVGSGVVKAPPPGVPSPCKWRERIPRDFHGNLKWA